MSVDERRDWLSPCPLILDMMAGGQRSERGTGVMMVMMMTMKIGRWGGGGGGAPL